MALKNKAADALAEAAANEEEKQARLKEMGDWNMTLAENQQVKQVKDEVKSKTARVFLPEVRVFTSAGFSVFVASV